MKRVRYALCVQEGNKPLTWGVFESRSAAETAMDSLRCDDAAQENSAESLWIAELGPEADGWVGWYSVKY